VAERDSGDPTRAGNTTWERPHFFEAACLQSSGELQRELHIWYESVRGTCRFITFGPLCNFSVLVVQCKKEPRAFGVIDMQCPVNA